MLDLVVGMFGVWLIAIMFFPQTSGAALRGIYEGLVAGWNKSH